eukprot:UN13598
MTYAGISSGQMTDSIINSLASPAYQGKLIKTNRINGSLNGSVNGSLNGHHKHKLSSSKLFVVENENEKQQKMHKN